MEVKHPDMEYIPIKITKTKINSAGNLFYVLEEHKIPTLLLQEDEEVRENEADD